MDALKFAEYGVYLLTVRDGDRINGMPLSLFSQVSFNPPLVIAGVSEKRLSHSMIKNAGRFAIIFLRQDQKELAQKFKDKDPDTSLKFEGLKWHDGKLGCPVLNDCLAYIECELIDSYDPGDHTVFIGEVKNAEVVKEGSLLLISDLGKYYKG